MLALAGFAITHADSYPAGFLYVEGTAIVDSTGQVRLASGRHAREKRSCWMFRSVDKWSRSIILIAQPPGDPSGAVLARIGAGLIKGALGMTFGLECRESK